jgi:tRNA wybutosine-synthesizing protein 3
MGWPLACEVLKPTGGILHVHENVREDLIDQFVIDLIQSLLDSFQLLDNQKKILKIKCLHIEKVKSYAPRVLHIVIDLLCFHD